jgi:hypothetical protein
LLACWTDPVPEMALLKVAWLERLKTSALLLTMLPVIEPVVVPLPSCSVPPLIVVPPV